MQANSSQPRSAGNHTRWRGFERKHARQRMAAAYGSEAATVAERDEGFMRRALELAAHAAGATAPNPAVGCVIVNDGDIVGEGYHPCAGAPHAEVFALRAAGAAAKGAAAYVTLEPCSHYGRTPPCAAALVDAGVARVVVAVKDPNPQVAGRGISRLEKAGIQVTCPCLQDEAYDMNREWMQSMEAAAAASAA